MTYINFKNWLANSHAVTLLLARLMGRYCFARWHLSPSSVVVCNAACGQADTACGRSALHSGPVVLHPVRATPCLHCRSKVLLASFSFAAFNRWRLKTCILFGIFLCLLTFCVSSTKCREREICYHVQKIAIGLTCWIAEALHDALKSVDLVICCTAVQKSHLKKFEKGEWPWRSLKVIWNGSIW